MLLERSSVPELHETDQLRKIPKSLKIADLASAPMNKKHNKNNSKDQRRNKDTK